MRKALLRNALIVLVGFAVSLWLNISIEGAETYPSSPQATLHKSWQLFIVLGPLLGFLSAWEASRFREILTQLGRPRYAGKVWLRSIAPLQLIAFLLVTLHFVLNDGFGSRAWPQGVLIIALHALVWASLGMACGLYFPSLIALPVAMFLSFVLQAYPPALSQPEWRYMFGQTAGLCCGIDRELNSSFVAASATMLAALLMAAWVLIYVGSSGCRGTTAAVAAGVAVALLGGFASYSQVAGAGYDVTVQRSEKDLVCSDSQCLWPETPEEVVAANRDVLSSLGKPQASLWDIHSSAAPEDLQKEQPQQYLLVRSTDPDTVELVLILQHLQADDALRRTPSCWFGEDGPVPVADAFDGVSPDDLKRLVLEPSGHLRQELDHEALISKVNEGCVAS